MTSSTFPVWKDCFDRWLRMMYISFIFSCLRAGVLTRVNWKHSRTYVTFCFFVYRHSSGILLAPTASSDDDEM